MPGEKTKLAAIHVAPIEKDPSVVKIECETSEVRETGRGKNSVSEVIHRTSMRMRNMSLDTRQIKFQAAANEIRDQIHDINLRRRLLLTPTSVTVMYMDAVMMLLLMFTATVTPFEVCFMEANGFDTLFLINRLVDVGFILDMVLHFFTAYQDEDGNIVDDHTEIVSHYLKTWFTFDAVTAVLPIPFEFIGAATGDTTGGKIKVLRAARIIRIIKILRIFRASRILQRWESRVGCSYSLINLVENMVLLTMLTHWGSCFWYLAASLQSEGENLNWIQRLKLEDAAVSEVYVRSLYNSVSIMYGGTNAGRFEPSTTAEFIMAIYLCICGATSYAYAISGMLSYVANKDKATKSFHAMVDSMNMFLSDQRMPKEIKERMRLFFQQAQPVIRAQYYNEPLRACSTQLRMDIVSEMHHHWFQHVKFFNVGIPGGERKDFMMAISFALQMRLYAKGERVIHEGELCDQLYVILKGLCALLGRVLTYGTVLGEDMVLCLHHREWRRHYTAVALCFAQLYMLNHDDFKNLLEREDLPVTRIVVRKHALRLCFCRTMVAVASSKELQGQVIELLDEHRQLNPVTAVETTRKLSVLTSQHIFDYEQREHKSVERAYRPLNTVGEQNDAPVEAGAATVEEQLHAMEGRMEKRMNKQMDAIQAMLTAQHVERMEALPPRK
jgi:CRP-like cAMP-binding protein